ncbi:type III-A CRISPR-associated RAMP protein Csm3 [Candidatus Micrarchaeota archaeon]|nr:type III-A CRISPR-associated RAMP protein Csm3 [Candidatus Micrarchaeota archaeon]
MKKEVISGNIKVLTGLHIGGKKDDIRIGGVDNPVIKLKNGLPYIPGSSLKGKLRCLLEKHLGKIDEDGKVHECEDKNCPICRLFGSSKQGIGLLIFRDAYINENDDEVKQKFYTDGKLDKDKIFEYKMENRINRNSGKAGDPREMERVVPGLKFYVEIIFNDDVEDKEKRKKFLENLKTAFELLQDDYLGGSGTRGYGKVDVSELIESIDKLINEGGSDENS